LATAGAALKLVSVTGRGSMFSVTVPKASARETPLPMIGHHQQASPSASLVTLSTTKYGICRIVRE
jgi:hypothetical protein